MILFADNGHGRALLVVIRLLVSWNCRLELQQGACFGPSADTRSAGPCALLLLRIPEA